MDYDDHDCGQTVQDNLNRAWEAESKLAAIRDLVVWSDPRRCGGEPCIRGTRVWVDTILNLAADCPDEEVVEFYPTVEPWQVAVLRILKVRTLCDC